VIIIPYVVGSRIRTQSSDEDPDGERPRQECWETGKNFASIQKEITFAKPWKLPVSGTYLDNLGANRATTAKSSVCTSKPKNEVILGRFESASDACLGVLSVLN
jgi:hypothetical protein